MVVVGSTGTGKSSTIARVTGAEVRAGAGSEPVTEACQLYTCTQGPVWVDTVGWEDRLSDNIDTFQVGRTSWFMGRIHTTLCFAGHSEVPEQ